MIKTVTLETAKALQEAKYKQESEFFYDYETEKLRRGFMSFTDKDGIMRWSYAAPTTDELLEELPKWFYHDNYSAEFTIRRGTEWKWLVSYQTTKKLAHDVLNESLPEALAAMWLWLKKEGLL